MKISMLLIVSVLPMLGCGDDVAAPDMAVDLSAVSDGTACPAEVPSGSCAEASSVCTYATKRCTCVSFEWYCGDLDCPGGAPSDGQSCSTAGASCLLGPEQSCTCVAPENTWACCGGTCPSAPPQSGTPCCGEVTCSFPDADGGFTECSCSADHHWGCS